MRILSKRAYSEACRELGELERASTSKRHGGNGTGRSVARQRQLRIEIERYELLKQGEIVAALGGSRFSLRELPMLLPSVRVAAGLSVAKLAGQLGVAPSVIAKSEAKMYQGVSLVRAAEILASCGASVQFNLELQSAEFSTVEVTKAILDAARRCVDAGKSTLAMQHLERGALLCESAGSKADLVELLKLKARLLHGQSEVVKALAVAKQVVTLVSTLADPKLMAEAQNACGALAKLLGKKKDARRHLQAALESCRESGDDRTLAMALSNMASIEAESGANETAETMYLEALGIQQRLGDTTGEARTLANLAIVVRTLAPVRSLKIYERCIELAKEHEDTLTQCTASCNLAAVMTELGLIDAAEQQFSSALESARRIRNTELEGLALAGQARLAHLTGDFVRARQNFDLALELLREGAEPRIEAQTRANYAGMLAGLGRHNQAVAEYRHALHIFKECDDQDNLRHYSAEFDALERRKNSYLGVRPAGLGSALRRAVIERLKREFPDRYLQLQDDAPSVLGAMLAP